MTGEILRWWSSCHVGFWELTVNLMYLDINQFCRWLLMLLGYALYWGPASLYRWYYVVLTLYLHREARYIVSKTVVSLVCFWHTLSVHFCCLVLSKATYFLDRWWKINKNGVCVFIYKVKMPCVHFSVPKWNALYVQVIVHRLVMLKTIGAASVPETVTPTRR